MRPTVLSVAIAMGINNVDPDDAQITLDDLMSARMLDEAKPAGFNPQLFTDADKERMVAAMAKRLRKAQKRQNNEHQQHAGMMWRDFVQDAKDGRVSVSVSCDPATGALLDELAKIPPREPWYLDHISLDTNISAATPDVRTYTLDDIRSIKDNITKNCVGLTLQKLCTHCAYIYEATRELCPVCGMDTHEVLY